MKTISDILRAALAAALLLWPMPALAREAPKTGFFRLANAVVQGSGALTMEIDGENVHGKGYQPGNVTGGVEVAVGDRVVKFSRVGTKAGSTRVRVVPNETLILIPYAERIPATESEPEHWQIRVLRLRQQKPELARSATFVSVSTKEEVQVEARDPAGRWNPVLVRRFGVTRAAIHHPRGYVPLRTGDGDLASLPVAAKGNYVVVLYDDDQGRVRSLHFRDRKFLSAD